MDRKGFIIVGLAATAASALFGGCVKREIEITSNPSGALVLLNGRDVGRTPAVVEFTFDGTYDVRLRLDGYDAVVGSGTTEAPVWDFIGADLVAEVWPAKLHRVDKWHFELVPEATAEEGLLQRASTMRQESEALPAEAEGAPDPMHKQRAAERAAKAASGTGSTKDLPAPPPTPASVK